MNNQDYFDSNQKLWDKKTDAHIKSDFYDMKSFMAGKTSLRKIELEELPDLNGKSLLHMQCHFGQDTLSLERMGAQCTAIDLSPLAIQRAEEIRDSLNLKSTFKCCNVYDIDHHIDAQFDIVFTSYGTIIWLPDLYKWAEQIEKRLKPGGLFFMTEFHPVLQMLDWVDNKIAYRYFNNDGPYEEYEEGTYADSNAEIKMTEYFWQHSMSEIIQALIDKGLRIELFKEYDYSPYDIFKGAIKRADQEYVFKHNNIDIPHIYTLKARK